MTVHPPVNGAPIVETVPDQVNTGGDVVALQVEAADPDGDPLGYVAEGLPPGVEIDPLTGVIAGIIAAGADTASPYDVVVTVTDPHGASVTTTFRWTIHPAGGGLLEVDIDIVMPCFFVNGFGVIPVIVYGNAEADGGDIDLATVRLEGMSVQRLRGRYLAAFGDYNGDGHRDVLVLIKEKRGAIPPGATYATLTGGAQGRDTLPGQR